jgi:hypothetical protein
MTAIRGVDDGDGGEADVVPFIALMTEARGDEDGAGEGRLSLNGDGDPNSEDDAPPAGEVFFIAIGLLLLSPNAMSARGRR